MISVVVRGLMMLARGEWAHIVNEGCAVGFVDDYHRFISHSFFILHTRTRKCMNAKHALYVLPLQELLLKSCRHAPRWHRSHACTTPSSDTVTTTATPCCRSACHVGIMSLLLSPVLPSFIKLRTTNCTCSARCGSRKQSIFIPRNFWDATRRPVWQFLGVTPPRRCTFCNSPGGRSLHPSHISFTPCCNTSKV